MDNCIIRISGFSPKGYCLARIYQCCDSVVEFSAFETITDINVTIQTHGGSLDSFMAERVALRSILAILWEHLKTINKSYTPMFTFNIYGSSAIVWLVYELLMFVNMISNSEKPLVRMNLRKSEIIFRSHEVSSGGIASQIEIDQWTKDIIRMREYIQSSCIKFKEAEPSLELQVTSNITGFTLTMLSYDEEI